MAHELFSIYWSCKRYHHFLIKQWEEDEYFVFDKASGDTHLLNDSGLFILRLLSKDNLKLSQLISKFDLQDPQEIEQIVPQLANHIQTLAQIGLIEPI